MMRPLFITTVLALNISTAFGGTYAIHGTLVTPEEVIEQGTILVQDGIIVEVGTKITIPTGTPEIDTEGFIYPGLIDLHNHVTWNAHQRWAPESPVKNRYDWQAMDNYSVWLSIPHEKIKTFTPASDCDLQRFGEVKALVWGATTIAGSLLKECSEGLIRNVDYGTAAFTKEPILYYVFPFELTPEEEDTLRAALKSGKRVITHLAEGTDASAAREMKMAKAHGYLAPGLNIIHGVALTESDFKDLGDANVGFIWSPRSNIELYGKTANVAVAKDHVLMAISPDWSPSGSSGMIPELRYAAIWAARKSPPVFTEKELVQMATLHPAALAGVGDKVGRLAKGYYADYIVIRFTGQEAYESLVYASMKDISLISVHGYPLFGQSGLMRRVNPLGQLESVYVCGETKALDMSDSDNGQGISFKKTITNLKAAFDHLQQPMSHLCQ